MLGFLIAVAAGFATPHLDEPVGRPLARALERHMTIAPGEIRVVSFMVALLAAAIVASLFDTGSAFGVIVGAVLGYFLLRISAVVKAAVDGKPR